MCFILKNKRNNPLQGFYPDNKSKKIGNIFPCGRCSKFFTFTTEKKVKDFKIYMLKKSINTYGKKKFTDIIVKFINNLKIKEL